MAIPAAHFEPNFVPMLKRLVEGESFTGRMSAAALFPVAYDKLGDQAKAAMRRYIQSISYYYCRIYFFSQNKITTK